MKKIQAIAIALLSIAISTACGASRSSGERGASELPTKVAHAKPRALPDERAAAEPPALETPTRIVPIEDLFNCEVERTQLRWRTRSGSIRTGSAVDLHFAAR